MTSQVKSPLHIDRGWLANLAGLGLALLLALALLLGGEAAQAAGDSTGKKAALAKPKPVVATGMMIGGTTSRTLFEAEISAPTGFTATVVPDPFRVIIDMQNVDFDMPSGAGRKAEGLVRQVRYGVIAKGKSRIVIDTVQPVLIERSYVVPAKGRRNARIALHLVATTQDVFAAAQQQTGQPSTTGSTEASPTKLTRPPPEQAASAPPPEAQTASVEPASAAPEAGTAESQPRVKPTIVIDAGHGGIDPGASSPGNTKEKDVVLAYAHALRKVLMQSGRYNVRMTRVDDRFLTLKDRVKFARDNKADLFIAIHADTVRGQTVRGTTLYTVSDKASDAEAEALAQKENRSDIIAGVDLGGQNEEVADILIDLAQRESKNHSMLFSREALQRLKGVTEMTGKPLRSAGFVVLKAPDVPSVLIELGYLSSKEDEQRLKSPQWQARMASAMGAAVDSYFKATLAAATP